MSGVSRDDELRSRAKSNRLLSVTLSVPPLVFAALPVALPLNFTFARTIPPATQSNCKLEISLDCTPKEFEKTIRQKTGIEECSRKRRFVDFTLEVFYIDFVELENPRKVPFVIRTQDQLEMFKNSDEK